jgi:hypothetical protein
MDRLELDDKVRVRGLGWPLVIFSFSSSTACQRTRDLSSICGSELKSSIVVLYARSKKFGSWDQKYCTHEQLKADHIV